MGYCRIIHLIFKLNKRGEIVIELLVMHTARSSNSPMLRSLTPSDFMTPMPPKSNLRQLKVHLRVPSYTESTDRAILTTKSTEHDEIDSIQDKLPATTIRKQGEIPSESSINNLESLIRLPTRKVQHHKSHSTGKLRPLPTYSCDVDSFQAKNDKQFHNYLSFLGKYNEYTGDTERFRRKLLQKVENDKQAQELKASAAESQARHSQLIYSSQLMKVLELRNLKPTESNTNSSASPARSTKSRQPTLNFSIMAKEPVKCIPSLTSLTARAEASRKIDLTGQKSLDEQLLQFFDEVVANFAEFLEHSSKHIQSYDYIKGYLLDKPEICDVFFNRFTNKFREPAQAKKFVIDSFSSSPLSKKSISISLPKSTNSNAVVFKDLMPQKNVSETKPLKFNKVFRLKMNLFNQELAKINIDRQLRDLGFMTEAMMKQHVETKTRYTDLMLKLRRKHKERYHNLKDVVETVERNYPVFKPGMMTRVGDVEKISGEIAELTWRNRLIAQGLDKFMLNWTKTVFEQATGEKKVRLFN